MRFIKNKALIFLVSFALVWMSVPFSGGIAFAEPAANETAPVIEQVPDENGEAASAVQQGATAAFEEAQGAFVEQEEIDPVQSETAGAVKKESLGNPGEDADGTYVTDEVIVVFNEEVSFREANKILEDIDSVDEETLTRESITEEVVVVGVADDSSVSEAVAELNASSDIAYAQPNYLYTICATPNDPRVSEQWAIHSTKLYQAWDLVKTNKTVSVAVVDTGIKADHEDLKDVIVPGSYKNVTGGVATGDPHGHGTQVAGVIGAQTDNGKGIAGVSHNAGIVPLRILQDDGTTMTTKDVYKAYVHLLSDPDGNGKTVAQEANVKVINVSLGTPVRDDLVETWVNKAYDAGILTVAAAGNIGAFGSTPANAPIYPGAFEKAINVSALKEVSGVLGDTFDASYSFYGTSINLSAPGTLILTTRNTSTSAYASLSGTSFAAPYVSGVAALLFAANPSATPAQVRSVLEKTAQDLGTPGRDNYYGHGQVDPLAAVNLMLDAKNKGITAAVAANQMNATITIMGLVVPEGTTSIQVPTWGSASGQNDLVWYNASKKTNGDWEVTIPISRHKEAGTYNSHVYAKSASGAQKILGATTFTINSVSLKIETEAKANGTIDITVKTDNPSGLQAVSVPVWSSKNGQDDIVWYSASKQSADTFKLTVSAANHKYDGGMYHVHAYATAGNGISATAATTTTVTIPAASINAVVSGDQKSVTVTASGATLNGASAVLFPTWGSVGGQNDIVWYVGTKNSNGTWSVTFSVNNHKEAGSYNCHVYATTGGTQKYIGATSFTVSPIQLSVTTTAKDNGVFDVVVKATSASGLQAVSVPVWSAKNGQDDLVWYGATRQTDGSFKVTVSAANHKNDGGTYNIHTYATAGNGIVTTAANTIEVKVPPATVNAVVSSDQKSVTITGFGGTFAVASSVMFPTWGSVGGQNDLVWYPAARQQDGSWVAVVPISRHKEAGTYQVHSYAVVGGAQTFAAATTFGIAGFEPSVTIEKKNNTSFDVIVRVSTPSGIQSVMVPIWSSVNGQDDLIWYSAKKQSNGSYLVNVSASNHKNNTGLYHVHTYVTAGNGIVALKGDSVTL